MSNKQIYTDNINISNTNKSLYKLSKIIQNYDKIIIKEIEPITEIINKNLFEGDFNTVIDELVILIFEKLNEGKNEVLIKEHVLNHINNKEIILQEVYDYLLSNQNNSNSIYLLGYFIYYGIATDFHEEKAIRLFLKAAYLQNRVANKHLTILWIPMYLLLT
ncbi:kinase-like domain-containing protein [Rhizophagus clarus]|uniref:Kinase-like domain-containing protein n=1 Tax=Rhizophagus clarus TaxID=94130 RepID=A0A8H3LR48_9GLOM|nr:kinase-like domain-containing protein [Rhizophagus clarus]